MIDRDKSILKDLQIFRCLSRDDIIDLHFGKVKNKITCANTVLKRMRRDGHIEVNTSTTPYTYFPKPSGIKKDSQKIPHFLAIVDVYKQMLQYEKPSKLTVEPKFEKKMCEPDMFVIWKKSPFFIEIQRSVYSKKVMEAKIQRYEMYYYSRKWQEEPWQPKGKTIFPSVLIITDTKYDVSSKSFRIFQASSIQDFIEKITKR